VSKSIELAVRKRDFLSRSEREGALAITSTVRSGYANAKAAGGGTAAVWAMQKQIAKKVGSSGKAAG
jgi:hypothetical protein